MRITTCFRIDDINRFVFMMNRRNCRTVIRS
jgi:hypothetical protein